MLGMPNNYTTSVSTTITHRTDKKRVFLGDTEGRLRGREREKERQKFRRKTIRMPQTNPD